MAVGTGEKSQENARLIYVWDVAFQNYQTLNSVGVCETLWNSGQAKCFGGHYCEQARDSPLEMSPLTKAT